MPQFSHLKNGATSSTYPRGGCDDLHRDCPTCTALHQQRQPLSPLYLCLWDLQFLRNADFLSYQTYPDSSFGPISLYLLPWTLPLPPQPPFCTARRKPLQESQSPGPVSARSLTRRPWPGARGGRRPAPGPGSPRQTRSRRRQRAGGSPRQGAASAAAGPGSAPPTARRPTCSPQGSQSRTPRRRQLPATARQPRPRPAS